MNGPFRLKAGAVSSFKMAADESSIISPQRKTSPLEMFVHSDVDIYVSKTIAETGLWEPYETQLLQQLLTEDSVFLDVGANIGYYTVLGSRWVGEGGKVFAFEPERSNFELLQKNVAHNDLTNVTAVHAGLSNISSADSSASLYLNLENRGDHQVFLSVSDAVPRQIQSIRLLNGSDYLGSLIDRVDVLKVDTQGAEMMVLQGLEPLLLRSLPSLTAIIEFSPFSLRQSGSSGIALLDLIAAWRLPMHLIDHLGHSLIPINYQEMSDWIDQTDQDAGNEGFVNLLLGDA